MTTSTLQTNQLSAEAFEWYAAYLHAQDRLDVPAYGAFLADDCVLQFANNPVLTGKEAILATLAPFWGSLERNEHTLLNLFGTDRKFALEALNSFTRKDGRVVTVPAMAVTERNENGLVCAVRVFMDMAPVFAQ
jgi:ketosteroid isomerase-like protein